jgi:hypothetical protein
MQAVIDSASALQNAEPAASLVPFLSVRLLSLGTDILVDII